jgi:hypothetical protein
MSPIGRVFIVLNLLLAGGFVAVSGTHMQQQHNYKTKLADAEKAHADKVAQLESTSARLEKERNDFENAKTANETALDAVRTTNGQLQDENKRLVQQVAQFEGDHKAMVASVAAISAELKAATSQAKAGYDLAIESTKTRDEAVRAKDAAEASNRDLNTKVAALEADLVQRGKDIEGLQKDRNELGLLVKVAEQYGFLRSMAAPNLSGQVTVSNASLCTIQIDENGNPGNIDIQEQIERGKWSFAVYDGSEYKGEAIATKYEKSANVVMCRVMPKADGVVFKVGDKAATKTP